MPQTTRQGGLPGMGRQTSARHPWSELCDQQGHTDHATILHENWEETNQETADFAEVHHEGERQTTGSHPERRRQSHGRFDWLACG